MSENWKVTLPCTRGEAETLDADNIFMTSSDTVPTIVTSENQPDTPDQWRIDIYCDAQPDAAFLKAVSKLAPLTNAAPTVERLENEDWVTLSQQGLEPLRAGRFYVHTSHSPPLEDHGVQNIRIDASRAFGTGHHETTLGCLKTLDRMKRQGKRFRNIIDVGTGTGLLAFAAKHLWPLAAILASDIDKVAVDVSRDNAAANGFRANGPRAIRFLTSNGLDHPAVQHRVPYDLIIANILAGPLKSLAPQIAAAAAPGTHLILAGLLSGQKNDVLRAYQKAGFRLHREYLAEQWPCLTLVKSRQYGRVIKKRAGKSPLAADYFGEC